MKIGVILPESEDFSPRNAGALARWCFEVYRQFDRQEVCIFCPASELPVYDEFEVYRVKTFGKKLPRWISFLNIDHHLRYNYYPIWAVIRARLKGIKTLHILNRLSYAIIGKKIYPSARFILHMQNDHLLFARNNQFEKAVMASDLIVGCSNYIRDGIRTRMNRMGLPGEGKVLTVYNGASQEKFALREDYAKRHVRQNLLFVGRLIPEKGVIELIRAFNQMAIENKKASLIIVGATDLKEGLTNEYVDLLRSESKRLGHEERIHFAGLVRNDQLPDYFENASMLVCPSIWDEPFGLVIAEAMAARLPVVASHRGGIPEIVQGGGLLVNPADCDELAGAMALLLNDLTLASRYSESGHERFLHMFTWRKIAGDWRNILQG